MKKSVTRLYSQFIPKNYKISLTLNPDAHTFQGIVEINGTKVGRPSHRITLHQKDLKIKNATITRHEKGQTTNIPIDRINTQKSYDEVRLHTEQNLFPGEYTVHVEFEGRITDQMNGLYPCYFTHDNKPKKLFATQFESHHAREVFPCIDEPEAKATFDLTLTTPDDGLTVLANTPVQSTKKSDKAVHTTFETTPIMSTYLLAFAYGEIGYKQRKTKNGTVIRTYATPDNVDFTEFALETAVRCLEFYEDYFGIPYPLEKCDMIALPDFASGAMENWGLITYREQTMLVDPKNTSLTTKQYVAMVVAHELAHQWFGNLVTMKWWTDLWLNEGFASWIEYLAVDHMFPEWDMWTQFIASEQQAALKLDALDNTHAIEAPINHPDEIRSIFDAISYNKGASVIHMLYGYLGEKDFQAGLRHYLKSHAYKNTVTEDLWAALEKVSGKPVKVFMHAWTHYPGFPLVQVKKENGFITLHQERFYMTQPEKKSAKRWPVPILGSSEAPEQFVSANESYKSNPDDVLSAKINRGQSGFYRTHYAPNILETIATNITKFNPLDRLGILADALETAKAGYAPTVSAYKLLFEYDHEDNAAVWDIIAIGIGELRRIMDNNEVREAIKPHIIHVVSSQLKRLGYAERKTDSHFDKLLRPTILALAASADEPKAKKWCLDSFAKAKSIDVIHADLRSVVFNTAARHGDMNTFERLLSFHDGTDLSEDRTMLAAALTSFEQPEIIKKSLEMIKTDKVRRQDAMYWIAYSFMNRHAKQATWEWMKDNWAWLDSELGSDLSFYRTPIYAARSFSSEAFKKEYEAFFKSKSSPALDRSIKQGLEMLEWQIAWRKRDLEAMKSFLEEK